MCNMLTLPLETFQTTVSASRPPVTSQTWRFYEIQQTGRRGVALDGPRGGEHAVRCRL
jgi:hypothetical protein